jgi:hypothetical protein
MFKTFFLLNVLIGSVQEYAFLAYIVRRRATSIMSDTVQRQDLEQELVRVNEQLDALRDEQQRVKKAAQLVASALRRMCLQEAARFGADIGTGDGHST